MADDVVGSEQPTFASDQKSDKTGYGQNGYSGASSDMPGEETCIPGYGDYAPLSAAQEVSKQQTRDVGTGNVPTTFGMKGPAPAPSIGSTPARPVKR